jgi:hypothetical protein
MSDAQRGVIRELAAALDNESLRGGPTREMLAVRQAAVDEAAAARQTYAYRQALLELAACAVGLAARMPAPSAPVARVARGGEVRDGGSSSRAGMGRGRAGSARRAA